MVTIYESLEELNARVCQEVCARIDQELLRSVCTTEPATQTVLGGERVDDGRVEAQINGDLEN